MLKLISGVLEQIFHWRRNFFQLLLHSYVVKYTYSSTRYIETAILENTDSRYLAHVLLDPTYLRANYISSHDLSVVLCNAFPQEGIYTIKVSEAVLELSDSLRKALYVHELSHAVYGHTYISVYTLDEVMGFTLLQFYQWLWNLLTTDMVSSYLQQECIADARAADHTSIFTVCLLLLKGSFCRDIVTKILSLRRIWALLRYRSTGESHNWRVSICTLKISTE